MILSATTKISITPAPSTNVNIGRLANTKCLRKSLKGEENWLLWNIKSYHKTVPFDGSTLVMVSPANLPFLVLDPGESSRQVLALSLRSRAGFVRPKIQCLESWWKTRLVLPQIFPHFLDGHRLGFGPQFCSKFREDVHVLHLAARTSVKCSVKINDTISQATRPTINGLV